MGTCENCRWWKSIPGYEETVRLCSVLTTIKLDIGELLVPDQRNERKEKVFTGREFGCIEFEVSPGDVAFCRR